MVPRAPATRGPFSFLLTNSSSIVIRRLVAQHVVESEHCGCIGVTRKYSRDFGEYPAREDLVALSRVSQVAHEAELEWLLHTGYLSSFYGL